MSESLREPIILDWENARACILKEKKPKPRKRLFARIKAFLKGDKGYKK